MMISELLAFTKEDLSKAKLCSDEIVDVINKYDLKPLLIKSILSITIEEAETEIAKLIRENNGKKESY